MRFAQIYAALGAAVAVGFLATGLARVDPASRGAYSFRPLLVPGLVLLWPLVLWRWRRLARPSVPGIVLGRRYRATHRGVWVVLAVALPVALLAAVALRQNAPDPAPLRLAPPEATP